jgi:hypothetical protein
LALNVEEHIVTQSLIGLGRIQDGKALEGYFRKSQMPPGEKFPPKCEQLVAAVRGKPARMGPHSMGVSRWPAWFAR